jgi:hypothetical protein
MVVHEYVHVVQAYPKYDPPWLVEGIADYIRFFMFEPVEKRPRPNTAKRHYTDGYRVAAAFLAWIEQTHDPEIITHLNSALSATSYDESIFKKRTGKTLPSLWESFAEAMQQ